MNKEIVLKILKENGDYSLFKEKKERQELEITDKKIDEIEKIKKLNIGSSLTARRY